MASDKFYLDVRLDGAEPKVSLSSYLIWASPTRHLLVEAEYPFMTISCAAPPSLINVHLSNTCSVAHPPMHAWTLSSTHPHADPSGSGPSTPAHGEDGT